MAARLATRFSPRAISVLRAAAWTLAALALASNLPQPHARAQTSVSDTYKVTDAMKAKLVKEGDLTLRDATLVEALFAIRRSWGINIAIPNDVSKETINCEFVGAPLYEVLDVILTPRGYSYRPLGNSLSVLKVTEKGPHPLFQTATIKVASADPAEVQKAVSFFLSDQGQIEVVASAKRLIVFDFPDRLEMIEQKAKELDDAAKEVRDEERTVQNSGAAPGVGAMLSLPAAPSEVRYFDLNFLKVETVAQSFQTVLNPTGRISVVPKDNRLIAVDTPDRLKILGEVIRQIDVPRPQVRIDALIYDASLEDVRHCGVNWSHTMKGTNLDATGIAQDSLALNALTAANPAAAAANGALTLTSLGSSFDLHAVINLLTQSKDSRLLSDPSVVVYDQETAKFEAVTEIPYQQLTQGLGGGSIGTTAFREAGTTLTVTPQISFDDEKKATTITMLVNPRFSVLAGLTPAPANQPIIDRREASTTVRVLNGQTIVIGGLRQRSAIKNMTGIPYLKDIKYVGQLFRDKQATVRESELIVFITPTVIDMGYVGKPRQECIYNSSLPELETIPYPKIPDYPCPPDQWPHRCGVCNKHHQGKCGTQGATQSYGPTPGEYGPPPVEALPPPMATPALPESTPAHSPAVPGEESPSTALRRLPVPSPPASRALATKGSSAAVVKSPATDTRTGSKAPSKSPVKTVVNSTTNSVRSTPAARPASVAASAAASNKPSAPPPLMTSNTLIVVPLEPVRDGQAKAIPILPVDTDEEQMAGQTRRLPSVASELDNSAFPQPGGSRRLTPARPIQVSERPLGTAVR